MIVSFDGFRIDEFSLTHKKYSKSIHTTTFVAFLVQHRNEIESLKTSENWVDWIKAFESAQEGLESLPRDERIEVIKQYIKKIETFFDPETRCHRFEMQFHLPIVNVNLVWNAAGNKKSGYRIQEGSDLAVLTAKKLPRNDDPYVEIGHFKLTLLR